MKTEHLRKKLQAEKARLESEMGSVGRKNPGPGGLEAIPSEVGVESDLVDQADVVTSRETNTAILADLEAHTTRLFPHSRGWRKDVRKCEVCASDRGGTA